MRVEYVGPDPDDFFDHYKRHYPPQGYGTREKIREDQEGEAVLLIATRWSSCE